VRQVSGRPGDEGDSAKGGETPPAAEQPDDAWTQHAAFSLWIDVGKGDRGQELWQTRIYHEESGDEIVLSGEEATGWLGWLLHRFGLLAGLAGSGPATASFDAATIGRLSVEVADVRLRRIDTSGPDQQRVHMEAELLLDGFASFQRVLGAAMVRAALAQERPETPATSPSSQKD
jgi:hypothetical protein